jgi:8-oxo-dGTP pyrophosphatase MutT (NUDIX family)
MPDRRAADEQRAAGAVVWRSAGNGSQVGLVHRPKYDDWSFPKGKLEPDEHVLLAAVREVAEETALQVTLGRRLPPVRYVNDGVPKRVDYWVATVERALAGFEANSEIDEVAWLAASQASERLSYSRDVETLGDFRGGPRLTAPLILVRHASAGSKSSWAGSDASRPLDSRGKKDAGALASLLRCFGVCRVISAPAERCVATMRPYAAATGGVIEIESAFDVVTGAGNGADESAVTTMERRTSGKPAGAAGCGLRRSRRESWRRQSCRFRLGRRPWRPWRFRESWRFRRPRPGSRPGRQAAAQRRVPGVAPGGREADRGRAPPPGRDLVSTGSEMTHASPAASVPRWAEQAGR